MKICVTALCALLYFISQHEQRCTIFVGVKLHSHTFFETFDSVQVYAGS